MQNKWRPFWECWVDERRFMLWTWPIGAAMGVGTTILMAWLIYLVIIGRFSSVGRQPSLVISIGFILLFAGAVYMCVGIYQLFFIELRKKFIASKVVYNEGTYKVQGYYFKRDVFQSADVASVESYVVTPRLGKSIATMFSWAPQTTKPNYKVTLKDSRVFYLPGDMKRVEELKTYLETDIQAEFAL